MSGLTVSDLFTSTASFSVCVDDHLTSFWIILDSSAPLFHIGGSMPCCSILCSGKFNQ